jgi:DNA-binding CsgD family transcriptional regulator
VTTRLGKSDLEQLLDVVQMVGDAQTRDEFLAFTLEGVLKMVPCMVAAVNEIDPSADRFEFWHQPSSYRMPENTSQKLLELGGENPLISHLQKTGDGSARRISDFSTREEFHATRLYQELYKSMRMEYQMSVTLPAPTPMVFAVVLGDGDQDFSESDRLKMNTVRPHLAHAWRNIRDQERLRALVDAASDASFLQGWGVIVLWDPPEELTPGTLTTLYRNFGRPSKTSPFPGRVQRWLEAQRAHLNLRPDLELRRPLSAEFDSRRIVLQYLPPQRAHPGAIVVREWEERERLSLETLGLSRREAQVVHLVTTGMPNEMIAEELHLAPGTVRKHLDNVYNKLGVRGRGALTAFVLDIAGR